MECSFLLGRFCPVYSRTPKQHRRNTTLSVQAPQRATCARNIKKRTRRRPSRNVTTAPTAPKEAAARRLSSVQPRPCLKNTHLLSLKATATDSSFADRSAPSVMRAPPSIRTAAHANCPSRRASSSGSTLLREARGSVVSGGRAGGLLTNRHCVAMKGGQRVDSTQEQRIIMPGYPQKSIAYRENLSARYGRATEPSAFQATHTKIERNGALVPTVPLFWQTPNTLLPP